MKILANLAVFVLIGATITHAIYMYAFNGLYVAYITDKAGAGLDPVAVISFMALTSSAFLIIYALVYTGVALVRY